MRLWPHLLKTNQTWNGSGGNSWLTQLDWTRDSGAALERNRWRGVKLVCLGVSCGRHFGTATKHGVSA